MAKILVVDDEPHMLELQKSVLSEAGFEVIASAEGNDALDILKKETVDLVLLDMMMPGLNGIELCRRIRENPKHKDLKVAFVTVMKFADFWTSESLNPQYGGSRKKMEKSDVMINNLKSNVNLLYTLNICDYMTKPFDNDHLVMMARKALKKGGEP